MNAHRPDASCGSVARLCVPALIATALGAAAPAEIHAQAPPPPILHACYVPSTGTVYRIQEPGLPGECQGPKAGPNQHVPFSWNQLGPAGAKGDQGDPGVDGSPGVSGWEIVRGAGVSTPVGAPEGARVTATVNCPTGKKPLGGGFSSAPLEGSLQLGLLIFFSRPAGTGWEVSASEFSAQGFRLAAEVVCAVVE